MRVAEYDNFVHRTNQYLVKPAAEQFDITIYGIASEIGSVAAAIKKKLLSEDGQEPWDHANDEIVEELGDALWYGFALARVANPGKPINIYARNIANLKREIGGYDDRAEEIKAELDPSKRAQFLEAAGRFPKLTRNMQFEDYQNLAFLTARTSGRTLIEICLADLWQLVAQLFRTKLPPLERRLNKSVADQNTNDILSEIAWHLAAIASIFRLRLSDIAAQNIKKISFRLNRGSPTPLHDGSRPPAERLPRRLEVSFVTVARGRCRMYLLGRQIGDDLTDNTYGDDGYRYHDIMHLAIAAKLGWSPVLRDLLKCKRKGDPQIDEVEDGARARITEEAIIKAIHSEGERLAGRTTGAESAPIPIRLFPNSSMITFRFLKYIHDFTKHLEVEKNRYWEWEEAIIAGNEIFYRLRCEEQGTVNVNLESRSIEFRPEVSVDLQGIVASIGSAYVDPSERGIKWKDIEIKTNEESGLPLDPLEVGRQISQKRAILDALGFNLPNEADFANLRIKQIDKMRISVKASGHVQAAIWERGVVSYRTAFVQIGDGICCTALLLADPTQGKR